MEEELRKEQVEMHKLLKAKQDLIDIQKKRIEHLTNRNGNSLHSNSSKSINNGNHHHNNSGIILQQQKSNINNAPKFHQLNNGDNNQSK